MAQHPKKYVVAFKGGFGGKTLLALVGTANPFYKTHIDPLYEHVLYIDPYSPNALDEIESVLRDHPVAVVQLELIQAVGGVRSLPNHVLEYLSGQKDRWGYLLLVDETQTGMYRTGPFVRSREFAIGADLLTIGKGTSDMMFPFALALYSVRLRKNYNLHVASCQSKSASDMDTSWVTARSSTHCGKQAFVGYPSEWRSGFAV